ncbi:MAG: hypothetical protein AAFN92_06575 [Bacteroidota bacterium]
MPWKTLLLCLLLTALFTSCTEKDGGLATVLGAESSAVNLPEKPVADNKGLPGTVSVETVSFLDDKGDVVYDKQIHLGLQFDGCGAGWCKVWIDDCGNASRVDYNYVATQGAERLTFAGLADSPPMRSWAMEGVAFKFERADKTVKLSCDDCPGRVPGVGNFAGRVVELSVH